MESAVKLPVLVLLWANWKCLKFNSVQPWLTKNILETLVLWSEIAPGPPPGHAWAHLGTPGSAVDVSRGVPLLRFVNMMLR